MRDRLGGPAQILVVAVGRLVEKKGFSYLLEAVRETPGLHVAIIGDGDLQGALEKQSDAIRSLR